MIKCISLHYISWQHKQHNHHKYYKVQWAADIGLNILQFLVQAYILTIVNTDFRSFSLLRSLLFTHFGDTQEA